MPMERRVLAESERNYVRQRFNSICYICETPLDGYLDSEIQFDHIYAYADGYSQDLSNFAPVHASSQVGKRNCHKEKGRKSPYQYKEERRIRESMRGITGLKDICPAAEPVEFDFDSSSSIVRINGRTRPLFRQKLQTREYLYFFDEIEKRHIENDDKIQLRPLEDKIYGMIFHLREHPQLLPSIGRIETTDKKVRIFDGQHKAVAQIVGNQRDRVPCIVFVNADVEALRVTVFAAHTDFLQQRYKRSHIDEKLAQIYGDRISSYREQLGDPQAPFTEKEILRHDSAAERRNFIRATISQELNDTHGFYERYVATDRKEQREKPMLQENWRAFIGEFCNLEAVEVTSDNPLSFRADELENVKFLLDCLEKHTILGKWNPSVPDAEGHKLSRKYYYDKAFKNWLPRLSRALRFAFDQMKGRASSGPLCYREEFSPEVRQRFDRVFERLATHGLWLNPANDSTISGNSERLIDELFQSQGLDYLYLASLS